MICGDVPHQQRIQLLRERNTMQPLIWIVSQVENTKNRPILTPRDSNLATEKDGGPIMLQKLCASVQAMILPAC